MAEHVCKWVEGIDREFLCVDFFCDAYLTMSQATQLLNEYPTLKVATERLSAEDASWIVKEGISREFAIFNQDKIDALRAYADTLEGE